ncbi:MAG: hypothetical protein ABSG36_07595, partial [Acidimicrobiales bacterium]
FDCSERNLRHRRVVAQRGRTGASGLTDRIAIQFFEASRLGLAPASGLRGLWCTSCNPILGTPFSGHDLLTKQAKDSV